MESKKSKSIGQILAENVKVNIAKEINSPFFKVDKVEKNTNESDFFKGGK